jgi:hypothetical protein
MQTAAGLRVAIGSIGLVVGVAAGCGVSESEESDEISEALKCRRHLCRDAGGGSTTDASSGGDASCVPDDAAACLNKTCGTATNNCGQTVACGTCASGASCTNDVCTTGTTIPAASCSGPDVQTAINAANDGDIVVIPPGTCTWTKTVTVGAPGAPAQTKFVTIRGAGMDQTTIVDAVNPNDANDPAALWLSNALHVFAKAGGLTRVTGMTFKWAPTYANSANKGMLAMDGDSTTWRVDHVHFVASGDSALRVGMSGGVVDHNVFDLVGWVYGIYGFNGGSFYGDKAWAEASPAGTAIPYFIEDNVFRGTINTVAHDGWSGERVVFRHNSSTNAVFANHGTESSGRWRGARFSEVYENTFTSTINDYYAYHPFSLRGGNGIYFNNTATGPTSAPPPYQINIAYFRDHTAYSPWGLADGHDVWDDNDPITSTVRFALDQTGRGKGDLLTGDAPLNATTGTATWPHQASEPSYAWNNTYNGNPLTFISESVHIVANRDFFNAPLVGYTPYSYPHPLALSP